MTIFSLYQTITNYSEKNSKSFFKPPIVHDLPQHFNAISKNSESAVEQLEVIKETVQNFQKLVEEMKKPFKRELNLKDEEAYGHMSYYAKILDELQSNEKYHDMLEDFNAVIMRD